MEKKEWNEPELIVLVRSKPEEAVLTACKDGAVGGDTTSGEYYSHCTGTVGPTACFSCEALDAS